MEFPPDTPRREPLAPHKITAQQQAIRDNIRQQVKGLPSFEAKVFTKFLNRTEAVIKAEKAKEAEQIFPWEELPGEAQNMILRQLMVSEQLIEPSLSWPKTVRKWRKYDLGSNILSVSKAMHQTALPILLGENTFFLNKSFNHVLGKGRKRSKLRGALVRKIITSKSLEPRMRFNLRKLTNLKEVTIVNDPLHKLPCLNQIQQHWEATARADFNSVDNALKTKIGDCPSTTFNFVSERHVRDRKGTIMAFRWKVESDRTADGGFKLTLVRKNQYHVSKLGQHPIV